MAGAAAAGVAVILAVSVLPAWTGGLYPIRYQVPGYWHELAADVNAGPGDTRVLLAPGASNTAYRWGMEGPDDVNLSLLSRPSVVRTTVPNGSFEQTNFLAALDLPLSTGDADPEVVAAMARYLGVAEVVVRNDQRWETFGGPRPSVVAERLAGDPSLDLVASYGRPGEHTVAPVSDFYPPDQALADADLPPLQRYAVARPRPIVRTEPTRGRCWSTATASPSGRWSASGWPRASRRSGCSAPSPRPSWPPRWPAGPGWSSPTATGGGPGAASAPARTTRPPSGPTSPCPPPPWPCSATPTPRP